mgnify:CR=1 FL=1
MGSTRTTRTGGGGPIVIPIETCASVPDTVANNITASSIAFMKVFILHTLPDSIIRTTGRNTLGSPICDCERCSWPYVQVVCQPCHDKDITARKTRQSEIGCCSGDFSFQGCPRRRNDNQSGPRPRGLPAEGVQIEPECRACNWRRMRGVLRSFSSKHGNSSSAPAMLVTGYYLGMMYLSGDALQLENSSGPSVQTYEKFVYTEIQDLPDRHLTGKGHYMET